MSTEEASRISPKRRAKESHSQKFPLGMAISKDFGEDLGGVYQGKIDAFDAESGLYTVLYEDDDTEDYDQGDIEELLLAEEDNDADEEDKAEIAIKKRRQQAPKKKKTKATKASNNDDDDDDDDSDNENNGGRTGNKKPQPTTNKRASTSRVSAPIAPPTLPSVAEFPTVASYVAASIVSASDEHHRNSPSPPPLGSCLYDDY